MRGCGSEVNISAKAKGGSGQAGIGNEQRCNACEMHCNESAAGERCSAQKGYGCAWSCKGKVQRPDD